MAIDKYLDLVTSQHREKPKFISWLSSTLTIIDDGVSATDTIISSFDIDNAVGVQLDVLGEIVGRKRALNFQPSGGTSPVLDDENYRIALKAKIAQNQWDGTIPQMYEIWDSLFPHVRLIIIDNQDMTMSALVDGPLSPIATELVASGFIIPKPMTVGLKIMGVTEIPSDLYMGLAVSEMDTIKIAIYVP